MKSLYYLCPHCHKIIYQSKDFGCPYCRGQTSSIVPERIKIERVIPIKKRGSGTKWSKIQKKKSVIPKVATKKIGYSHDRKFAKLPKKSIRKEHSKVGNSRDVEKILVDRIVNFVFKPNRGS
jgi:rRNA maturation protein Nop10